MKVKQSIVVVVALFCVVSAMKAQPPDPSTLPLLTQASLTYVGGFRTPDQDMNGENYTWGGKAVAYNSANNSLFVGNTSGTKIAEISIPPLSMGSPKQMSMATYVQQAFVDPTEGHIRDISTSDTQIYGLLVYGNRLLGSANVYYDAPNRQRQSHFSRSLSLTTPSFSGWSQVWDADKQGFLGLLAVVPAEWRSLLGGPAITGQCCIPIIDRTSRGPAAFAFDPALVGQAAVPAQPLVYYDKDHQTLGTWESSNLTYGMATRIGGVAIIHGTRTALFVGSNGTGPGCYGGGTANKALVGTLIPNSQDRWCYDPVDPNKGTHSYPYQFLVWAYDLNDWAAVKDGAKKPWEVKPYGVWPLPLPPTPNKLPNVGGVGYDSQNQLLYASEREGISGEFTSSPVIRVFKVDAKAGPIVPPPTPTAVTATLTSSPTSIGPGQSATLSWTTANATTMGINQGIGAVSATGTQTVTPSATTTYALTASNANGAVQASTTVTVTAAPPPPPPPPVDPPPPTGEVAKLKAEIAKLQVEIAAERATVTKLNQQLAAAQAAGTKTAAEMTALRTARDAALKRIAEKDALAQQLIKK